MNNIEILLRLYCFETEIKESVSNYEKIKTPPSGSLIDIKTLFQIIKNFWIINHLLK